MVMYILRTREGSNQLTNLLYRRSTSLPSTKGL